MLHHSNSRHQRNRGSKIKTLLKVTLLLGVAVWLVYQVKHSYDKKTEYLNATENQLSHDDRSMFQGRKERVGGYGVGDVDKAIEDIDVISNKDEEKSGETVFEKDNTDSHDDDAGNAERSEAEEEQASRADGNAEAHGTDSHSAAVKLDAESNSSDGETKSEVHSVEDDVPQNKDGQEGTAGEEVNGTTHEEKEQSDSDQINASSNGSDGEQAEKKEEVESQADSGSLSDDTKAGTSDEHSTETLPDETGNIPAVHTENPQNGASENPGDSSSEAVHVEIGSEHEGAKASSGTASGDAEKGNSVESNPSDGIFVEEKAETASGGDEKGAETGTANEASGVKEANPEEGNAATEVRTDQAASTQTENPQEASAAEGTNGSVEEIKPVENQVDGATKASSNGDQEDIKIETNTSTNNEHSEHQSVDASSGSTGSSDSGPEQTGKTETQ
ncbi:dentin sialophosphoprotein-like [Lolium rigidum]|uniref:dentin sialophosphoprotein-like n=1 Tax=Lolium rigidum TaxID=89674 RepID=UPI001F5C8C31|nr:dentin sialophosphoprotein-like [Lolium rigidum]XP_051199622.1 uncharacterized protein LOC127313118 [Lolium perenne]XP_051199623.1 uncharacterized protein LOC127313118 [Lolium perenne]